MFVRAHATSRAHRSDHVVVANRVPVGRERRVRRRRDETAKVSRVEEAQRGHLHTHGLLRRKRHVALVEADLVKGGGGQRAAHAAAALQEDAEAVAAHEREDNVCAVWHDRIEPRRDTARRSQKCSRRRRRLRQRR
eukprot:1269008-Pleurochrysis_carterae.AAC.3